MTRARETMPRADVSASQAAGHAVTARDAYRQTLLELARADARIFCLDSDMGGLEDSFGGELPEQYVNLGIAEANLIGVAAGLAAAGLIPFANTMSAFATARACEQLKIDVAANNLPVRIVASHAGLSAGHYGHTHHATEDLAILRCLPNMTVIVPADATETELAVRAVAAVPGPVFIRLGRAATPVLGTGPHHFTIGQATEVRAGDDVTIVATGAVPVGVAISAAEALAGLGVYARVLNMHTIKPFDGAAVGRAARETAGIVTVEDHAVAGGLGSAVCEVVCATYPCQVRRLGVPDVLVEAVGSERELLAGCGVTAEGVAAHALSLLGGKPPVDPLPEPEGVPT